VESKEESAREGWEQVGIRKGRYEREGRQGGWE
jgi:hypothetical protein